MVKPQAPKLRLCRRIGVLNELISLAYIKHRSQIMPVMGIGDWVISHTYTHH